MQEKRSVLNCLPPRIRRELEALTDEEWVRAQEVRLRLGNPVVISFANGERSIPGQVVERADLEQTLELASRASFHTVLPQLRQGFLTLRGGHRLGICGSVRLRDGMIHAINPISSMNLRLARQVPEAGTGIVERICREGRLRSTLILASPGAGKTTLLRNIIKGLSDGDGCLPHRVGLADERGEVAALYDGVPQLNVGERTDVLEGCPKAQALMLLLRGMNPRVLAVDEITAPEDIATMKTAAGCGVALLATAHGAGCEDLTRRPLYRELLESGIFEHLLTIQVEGGQRRYKVEDLI